MQRGVSYLLQLWVGLDGEDQAVTDQDEAKRNSRCLGEEWQKYSHI